MKRIGLISDTHGTFDQTLKTFLKDVDEIWHAVGTSALRRSPTRSRRSNPCGPSMAISTEVSRGRTYREFLLRVRRGERPDDPHRRLTSPLHPAGRSADPIAAPENLHRGALPHSQGHLRPVYDLLHLNPGAAGCYGFHKVRSALRFTIDGTDIRDMEIGEWPRPGA